MLTMEQRQAPALELRLGHESHEEIQAQRLISAEEAHPSVVKIPEPHRMELRGRLAYALGLLPSVAEARILDFHVSLGTFVYHCIPRSLKYQYQYCPLSPEYQYR